MKSLAAFSFAILFCLANLFWPVKNVASATKVNLFVKSDPSSQAIFAAADLKPKEKIEYSYALGKAKFDAALDGIGVKRKFKLKNMSAKEQLFEFRVSSNITINPKSGTLKAGESVDVDFDLIVRGPDDGLRHSAIHVVGASSTTKLAEINNGWRLPFSDSEEHVDHLELPLDKQRTETIKLDCLGKDLTGDSIVLTQTGKFFTAKLSNEGKFAAITITTRGNDSGRGLLTLRHKATGTTKPIYVRVERNAPLHIVPRYSFVNPLNNRATKFAIVLRNGSAIKAIPSKIKSDNGTVRVIASKPIGNDLYVECRLERLDKQSKLANVSVEGYPTASIKIVRFEKLKGREGYIDIDRFDSKDLASAIASVQRTYFPRKTRYETTYQTSKIGRRAAGEKGDFDALREQIYLNVYPSGEFVQARSRAVEVGPEEKQRSYYANRSTKSGVRSYFARGNLFRDSTNKSSTRIHDPFYIPFALKFWAKSLSDVVLGHPERSSIEWHQPVFIFSKEPMNKTKKLLIKLSGVATSEYGNKSKVNFEFDVDNFLSAKRCVAFRSPVENPQRFFILDITKTSDKLGFFSIPDEARLESFTEKGELNTIREFKLLNASFSTEAELTEDRRQFENRNLLGWKPLSTPNNSKTTKSRPNKGKR